jgi:hypothetical protein
MWSGRTTQGIDMKGSAAAHLTDRRAQRFDIGHEQVGMAVEQIDREK